MAVLSLLLLAACGAPDVRADAPPDSADPVEITFYTYNYASQHKDGVDLLIKEFEEQNRLLQFHRMEHAAHLSPQMGGGAKL